MNESNPYAAPSATAVSENISTARVAGEFVFGRSPIVLPPGLCVACGAEDDTGSIVRQDLVYAPIWMSAILLGSCVIYIAFPIALIVYFVFRKRLKLNYWMCRDCRSRRRWKVAGALASGTLALAICFVAEVDWMWLIGVPAFLVGVYMAAFWSHSPIRLGRDGDEFTLKKLHPHYLERLQSRLEAHDEALQRG